MSTATRPALVACNTCRWTKPIDDPSPCPKRHATGFAAVDPEDTMAAEVDPGAAGWGIARVEAAVAEVCAIQGRLDRAVAARKRATALVTSTRADLCEAAGRLARLRAGLEPDPERHPLFDKDSNP